MSEWSSLRERSRQLVDLGVEDHRVDAAPALLADAKAPHEARRGS